MDEYVKYFWATVVVLVLVAIIVIVKHKNGRDTMLGSADGFVPPIADKQIGNMTKIGIYGARPGYASESALFACQQMNDCAGVCANADDSQAILYRGDPKKVELVDAPGWTTYIPNTANKVSASVQSGGQPGYDEASGKTIQGRPPEITIHTVQPAATEVATRICRDFDKCSSITVSNDDKNAIIYSGSRAGVPLVDSPGYTSYIRVG
ncbi:MAG: hypothetical protein KGL39_21015 [Patescibacteria group bacterium]|nr:hypothetical protein [Patescibacteria group bacterium]